MESPAFTGDCPVKFGTKVRNKVSGVEGIVTAKYYQISGCTTIYYHSQTEKDQNNKPVGYYDTLTYLEVLEGGIEFGPQPPEESNFKLGEKVNVPYLQVQGVVTCLSFYPDQATHIEVQPPYNSKEGKKPSYVSVPEGFVVSLENKAKEAPAAAQRPSPPHCPGSPEARTSGRD